MSRSACMLKSDWRRFNHWSTRGRKGTLKSVLRRLHSVFIRPRADGQRALIPERAKVLREIAFSALTFVLQPSGLSQSTEMLQPLPLFFRRRTLHVQDDFQDRALGSPCDRCSRTRQLDDEPPTTTTMTTAHPATVPSRLALGSKCRSWFSTRSRRHLDFASGRST